VEPGSFKRLLRRPSISPAGVTGGCEATVAATLASVGLPFAVVNPQQIQPIDSTSPPVPMA
jgi:hypothetical protein